MLKQKVLIFNGISEKGKLVFAGTVDKYMVLI
jgi:hypothetical protein